MFVFTTYVHVESTVLMMRCGGNLIISFFKSLSSLVLAEKLELTVKIPSWLLAQLCFTHYLSIYFWTNHSHIKALKRPNNLLPYSIFSTCFIVVTFICSTAVIQKECNHTPMDFIILWKTMTVCRRHTPSFRKKP